MASCASVFDCTCVLLLAKSFLLQNDEIDSIDGHFDGRILHTSERSANESSVVRALGGPPSRISVKSGVRFHPERMRSALEKPWESSELRRRLARRWHPQVQVGKDGDEFV